MTTTSNNEFHFHDYSCSTTNVIQFWYELKNVKNWETDESKVELYYSSQHFGNFIAYLYGHPLRYKKMNNLFVLAYLAHKFRVPELSDHCENLLTQMVSKWLRLNNLRQEILKFLWSKGVDKLFNSRISKFIEEGDIKEIIKLAENEKERILTSVKEEQQQQQESSCNYYQQRNERKKTIMKTTMKNRELNNREENQKGNQEGVVVNKRRMDKDNIVSDYDENEKLSKSKQNCASISPIDYEEDYNLTSNQEHALKKRSFEITNRKGNNDENYITSKKANCQKEKRKIKQVDITKSLRLQIKKRNNFIPEIPNCRPPGGLKRNLSELSDSCYGAQSKKRAV
ncbi:2355_t:CDS:2 [Diversispora eburnea]|uniref:2355_t:CDS:1 n=1 Tax=Diversispora eburnea TaxID=1213867 RepID=A0A9N8UXB3_9GLOM|nr:2355_t:CDS:2 [Diversispora eburnea]